ncbi:MAG: hypothetical protein Q9224_004207, partial [Gallowayella concinna]
MSSSPGNQAAPSEASPQHSPLSASYQSAHVGEGSSPGEWIPADRYGHRHPMKEPPDLTDVIDRTNEHGRQRARRSAGFLLQDAAPRYTYETLKPPQRLLPSDTKGKRRAENGGVLPSRRAPSSRPRQQQSIGSSPLSTTIYNSTDRSGSRSLESYEGDEILLVHGGSGAESQISNNGSPGKSRSLRDEERGSVGEVPSAIGYDTDPAQIVNLALKLSESRRRVVSGGGLPPLYTNGNRRHVSSEQNPGRLSGSYDSVGGANLRRHLNEQRRISRNFSPRSSRQFAESPSSGSSRSTDGRDASTSTRYLNCDEPHDLVLQPSNATLARAEKARIAFELAYEYRRLLQYLPPLPVSSHSRPTRSKSDSDSEPSASGNRGRAYDPLQYIRNRKVRGRERKLLDAEAEGCHDLNRVKLWIDTIASEREATNAAGENQNVLPSLQMIKVDPQAQPTQTASTSDGLARMDARPTKSERQYLDWKFTPWDLLADAAWLSHEENMRLIEDAKGNKLLPQKKLSKENTPRTSLEKTRGPDRRSLSLVRRKAHDERQRVELNTPKKNGKTRGHTRGKSSEPNPLNDYESPRDRKGRWHRSFGRSRSPSSSEDSTANDLTGYAWGNHPDRDGLDSAALEKQMMKLLAKEIEEGAFSNSKLNEATQKSADGVAVDDERRTMETPVKRSQRQAVLPEGGTSNSSSVRSHQLAKSSLEQPRGRHSRSTLDNHDDSTPNSPSNFRFGPSIFVNRSAPNSRSVSPKKPLPSRLRPSFRNSSKSRRTVSEYNIVGLTQSPTGARLPHTSDFEPVGPHQAVQKSDSASNLLSPVTAELFGKRFRRMNNSSASIKAGKESKDPDSKFRGLLKGTRIAELVGSEVSRVGDMIWRRDGSNLSQPDSPVTARAPDDSETEGEFSTMENSPETDLSRVTTTTDDGSLTKTSQPRYHHPNLPTFRSSISQSSPGSPQATSPGDHPITRQQLAQKARGRSSKFERLAPPKIDMRNVSPSASPPLSRIQTRDTDVSRNTSTSRSDHGVRNADRRLNDVLGIPGAVRSGVAPTGLANLSSKSSDRPGMGDRQWSISDRSVSNTRRGTVTKRDIARVRALLLSSGIKANEIARQADTINDPPFLPQLREIHRRWDGETKSIPKVPRQQEHLLTAKLIVQEIDNTNQRLRDAAEVFLDKTVEGLHQRLKDLDADVSSNLFPAVRGSVDDADNLSTELTTTHTLAVKRVNDAV